MEFNKTTKKKINDVIEKISNFDPLLEAEKLTGKSYKNDDSIVALGMILNLDKSKTMDSLMDLTDDTKFSESEKSYYKKVTDFGFKEVLKEKIDSKDNFYVMFHDEYSILLVWDTFDGSRNGGSFYYNWSPNDINNRFNFTSSGSFIGFNFDENFNQIEYPDHLRERPKLDLKNGKKYSEKDWKKFDQKYDVWLKSKNEWETENNFRAIWEGNHDCREALKFNISRMAENGIFLKKWIKCPFLWLLHHKDIKDPNYDYKKINEERIKKLPKYIINIINYFKNE